MNSEKEELFSKVAHQYETRNLDHSSRIHRAKTLPGFSLLLETFRKIKDDEILPFLYLKMEESNKEKNKILAYVLFKKLFPTKLKEIMDYDYYDTEGKFAPTQPFKSCIDYSCFVITNSPLTLMESNNCEILFLKFPIRTE